MKKQRRHLVNRNEMCIPGSTTAAVLVVTNDDNVIVKSVFDLFRYELKNHVVMNVLYVLYVLHDE